MCYLETGKKIKLDEKTTIEFLQDDCRESPREWDNLGTFVNYHSDYLIGDKNLSYHDYPTAFEFLESEGLKVKDVLLLPVYIYDHSGITINTIGFSCCWDSDRIGFIYVTKEALRKEYGVKRIGKKLKERFLGYLRNEIATLDQFLTGAIYGYNIEEINCCESCDSDDAQEIDSCWGFYGNDIKENGMLHHIESKYHQTILSALS